MAKEMKPLLYRKTNFKDHNREVTWMSTTRGNKRDRSVLPKGSDYDAFAFHLASGSMDEVNVAHPHLTLFHFLPVFLPLLSLSESDSK